MNMNNKFNIIQKRKILAVFLMFVSTIISLILLIRTSSIIIFLITISITTMIAILINKKYSQYIIKRISSI